MNTTTTGDISGDIEIPTETNDIPTQASTFQPACVDASLPVPAGEEPSTEEQPAEEPTYLVNQESDLPKALTSVILRRGVWSLEEERFAEKVICNFENGTLDVPKNTTLRMYLARVLNCDPMRISKKYNGNWRVRRRYFAPLSATPENENVIQTSRRELEELKRVWVNKLRLIEKRDDRKRGVEGWGWDSAAAGGDESKPYGSVSSDGSNGRRVPGPKDRSRYGLEDTITKQFFIVKQAVMASPDELVHWNSYFEGLTKRLPKKTPFSATAKAVARQQYADVPTSAAAGVATNATTSIAAASAPSTATAATTAAASAAADDNNSSDSEAEADAGISDHKIDAMMTVGGHAVGGGSNLRSATVPVDNTAGAIGAPVAAAVAQSTAEPVTKKPRH